MNLAELSSLTNEELDRLAAETFFAAELRGAFRGICGVYICGTTKGDTPITTNALPFRPSTDHNDAARVLAAANDRDELSASVMLECVLHENDDWKSGSACMAAALLTPRQKTIAALASILSVDSRGEAD